MPIGIKREHPDGLDPVFDAYRFIQRVFACAEAVEEDHPMYDDMVIIPGTGEAVDMNDANVLNQLERWLAENAVGAGKDNE
jgi:hypothetical protein